ncbi:flagellar assembly protein FliH [Alkalihalobacillus sp. AL-G]|uniref:flagellar assembly protein FliH n=1 Tax=Alkalihalobacillus sp. AL-G TaxID=2926399 RepID=UPI00272BBE6B|nr:flagellar assembly protein FliH [Alkalihalobacillus sp. AL-G]WLD95152.1 flagellar assembly protein FliH [Alkalihalobacillus sp. AL-G]
MSKLIKQLPVSGESNSIQIGLQQLSTSIKRIDNDAETDHETTLVRAKEEAESIVGRAEQKAEQILAEANEKADDQYQKLAEKEQSILQQTNEAIEEGKQTGFKEGYNTGIAQAEKDYHDKLTEARTVLSKAKAHYCERLNEAEPDLVSLSLEISRKILGTSIQMDEIYQHYIKEALKQVKGEEDVKLFVAPEQYEDVLSIVKKQKNVFNVDIMVYPDESMSIEQCLIETKYGQIDASIDSQLKQLKEKLLELVGEEDEHSTVVERTR